MSIRRALTAFSLLIAMSGCHVSEGPTGPDGSSLTAHSVRTSRLTIEGDLRVSATFGDIGIGPAGLFTNAEACNFGYERTEGTVRIRQRRGRTIVRIKIEHAVPNEFHTVWLRLDGSSPLSGLPATPLVPTSGLEGLRSFTPPNPGGTYPVNGFWTGDRGKGRTTIPLDFLLSDGVYPFPNADVPIASEPFTIAIASHCVDHVGHGLVPGPHENTQQATLIFPLDGTLRFPDDDDDDDHDNDDDDEEDDEDDDGEDDDSDDEDDDGTRAIGIVHSVVKAPIVPDGNVAGAATDLVINLDTSLDPSIVGRTLLSGRTIKIVLPDAFVNTGAPAVADVFSSATCVPGNVQCTTGVLLPGWPQHPILPRVPPVPPGTGTPQYTMSLEGTHTVVYTANVDIVPGVPLPGPGIKQAHLILKGFRNPRAGFYAINVVAETGPGGAVETGSALVRILDEIHPSIEVTSAFNAGSPNTIYQQTMTGAATPLPYDFLLWDDDGDALTDVTVHQVSAKNALLRRGTETVGRVSIETPPGATGQQVSASSPSAAILAPISAVPAGRLTVNFTAGSIPGDYTVTFTMREGNSVQMFVTAS